MLNPAHYMRSAKSLNKNEMSRNYSTPTDLKLRYGGVLENPYVSKIHRHCLDGFKVKGLRDILKDFYFENILDVGCGLGEYSTLNKGPYVGLDNSYPRVAFARRQYPRGHFIHGDAVNLPFKNNSFEAVLLANTAHHLSDEQLRSGMLEMQRISRRYIIMDDCVKTLNQSRLSRYFYSLDRGTMFRTADDFVAFFKQFSKYRLVLKDVHYTFPKLYTHAVFVLELRT